MSGGQCRNRTTSDSYCWIHSQIVDKLRVKDSKISGKGLFASDWKYRNMRGGVKRPIIFHEGDKISDYTGDSLTFDQVYRRYPGKAGTYILQVGPNKFIDARSTTDGLARFANSTYNPRGRPHHENAFLMAKRGKGFLEASDNIRQGEEILCDYSGRPDKLYVEFDEARPGKKKGKNKVKKGQKKKKIIVRKK